MRQIFDDFRAALWHDFLRFVWCVRIAIFCVVVALLAGATLGALRYTFLKVSAKETCDCRSSWERMSPEEREATILKLLGRSAHSIASNSSADDQKRETEARRPTTTPTQKTP